MFYQHLKIIACLFFVSSVFVTTMYGFENQHSEENNMEVGQIKEIIIKIKGLVEPASITSVINVLQKIDGVKEAIVINIKQGEVKIILNNNNKISFIDFYKQIVSKIKSAQCLCDAIKEVTATGIIKKDKVGFFLHIGKSNEKLYFTNQTIHFKKLKSKIDTMLRKKELVFFIGKVHSHMDESIAIDGIKKIIIVKN
ncbi:hypothetical protein COB28_04415 [Candidatus Dependentiae bacterium]|nr:MAG: hypothetical protein COB28_04415 [Candidatus Dependentiae bacterium]